MNPLTDLSLHNQHKLDWSTASGLWVFVQIKVILHWSNFLTKTIFFFIFVVIQYKHTTLDNYVSIASNTAFAPK